MRLLTLSTVTFLSGGAAALSRSAFVAHHLPRPRRRSALTAAVQPPTAAAAASTAGVAAATAGSVRAAELRERFLLYNTLERAKVPFTPEAPPRVTFYSCGPTVYDYAHIGNFRAFLTYDLLKRWLSYLGEFG